MTISAVYRVSGVPVLLSDYLVTGSGAEIKHRTIPSVVDVADFLPPDWLIGVTDLRSKVYKPHENLLISGSGSGLSVAQVFNRLRRSKPIANRSGLGEVFGAINDLDSDLMACVIVGWLVADGEPASFRWNSRGGDLRWDENYIEGSGGPLLLDIAWARNTLDFGSEYLFELVAEYCLTQTGTLLSNEIPNGKTLESLCGGGYDLYIWDGQRFVRIEDITYLFINLESAADIRLHDQDSNHWPLVLKHAYLGELAVEKVLILDNVLGVRSDPAERAALIFPLIRPIGTMPNLDELDLTKVPWESRYIVVCMFGKNQRAEPEVFVAVVMGQEAAMFQFHYRETETEGVSELRLGLPMQIWTNIVSAARSQFATGRH